MRTCSVDGCSAEHVARGCCAKHYMRLRATGSPVGLKIAERGTSVNRKGYRVYADKPKHITVAERAMGKPLPAGAIVHHWDENRTNNQNSNLLVCSRAYHALIHARMRAMAACGNPDWAPCKFCKKHDDPKNLYISPGKRSGYHYACCNEANRLKRLLAGKKPRRTTIK